MLDILQPFHRPEDLAAGGVIHAVIALYQPLHGAEVITDKGKILAHLFVVSIIRIGLPELILVPECIIEREKIMQVPFRSERKVLETRAIAIGTAGLTII